MTTGADHYRMAEELLRVELTDIGVAAAQVHATLAVAAATADYWPGENEENAWRQYRHVTKFANVPVDESPKQPRRGDIWMDSFGRRWLVQIATVPTNKLWLVCLDSHMTEDFFAEVADEYGPMRLWHRPQLAEDDEEMPF